MSRGLIRGLVDPTRVRYEMEVTWKAKKQVANRWLILPVPSPCTTQPDIHLVKSHAESGVRLELVQIDGQLRYARFDIPKMQAGETKHAYLYFEGTIYKHLPKIDPDIVRLPLNKKGLKQYLKPCPDIESNHPLVKQIARNIKRKHKNPNSL